MRFGFIKKHLLAIIVISLSFVYQVHCAIRGFDLTDEGYLMTIYQWFGTDVNSAQGAGGYPLTAYLGWLLNSAFSNGGILGMRLCGIMVVTLTEIILYCYLKKHFNSKIVLVGLIIQTVFVSGDPKPFGYNNLTAFFVVISTILLLEGVMKKKWYFLLFSGIIIGINIFIRIPNIAYLSFMIIPYVHPLIAEGKIDFINSTKATLICLFGCIFSFVPTWMFISHLGADKLILELVYSLSGMLDGESTHSTASMTEKYCENMLISFHYCFIFIFSIIIGSTYRFFKQIIAKLIIIILAFMIVYRSAYMYASMLGDSVLGMMNGIGLFGCCYYFFKERNNAIIALSAIVFSLIVPLGSDQGYQTMWVGTWFSLPLGLCGLYAMTLKDQDFLQYVPLVKLALPAKNIRLSFLLCLFTLLAATIAKVEHRSYYDPGHKLDKTYSIESAKARGVYTVQKRARVLNPLLRELKEYIEPGDTVLFFDSSPMLYYLTQTKPFAGISWPCVFYGQPYVDKFMEAESKTSKMPLLVIQNFWSGNWWSFPQKDYFNPNAESILCSREMKTNLHRFVKAHKYKKVWSNKYYDILIATKQ